MKYISCSGTIEHRLPHATPRLCHNTCGSICAYHTTPHQTMHTYIPRMNSVTPRCPASMRITLAPLAYEIASKISLIWSGLSTYHRACSTWHDMTWYDLYSCIYSYNACVCARTRACVCACVGACGERVLVWRYESHQTKAGRINGAVIVPFCTGFLRKQGRRRHAPNPMGRIEQPPSGFRFFNSEEDSTANLTPGAGLTTSYIRFFIFRFSMLRKTAQPTYPLDPLGRIQQTPPSFRFFNSEEDSNTINLPPGGGHNNLLRVFDVSILRKTATQPAYPLGRIQQPTGFYGTQHRNPLGIFGIHFLGRIAPRNQSNGFVNKLFSLFFVPTQHNITRT